MTGATGSGLATSFLSHSAASLEKATSSPSRGTYLHIPKGYRRNQVHSRSAEQCSSTSLRPQSRMFFIAVLAATSIRRRPTAQFTGRRQAPRAAVDAPVQLDVRRLHQKSSPLLLATPHTLRGTCRRMLPRRDRAIRRLGEAPTRRDPDGVSTQSRTSRDRRSTRAPPRPR